MKTSALILSGVVLAAIGGIAVAKDSILSVVPNKCVALRKGQVCYQTVKFQFQGVSPADYCLVSNRQSEPLRCWTTASSGEYIHKLASDAEVQFQLLKSDLTVVAETKVTIAWVYKQSRSRSRWRLF